MTEHDRQLVTIRKIKEIHPIANADKIIRAVVDGWSVVVGKDQFKVGDDGVFFEIDSFIPLDVTGRFDFLESKAITYNGIRGVRIKSMKLKKTLSQGLLMPVNLFPEIKDTYQDEDYSTNLSELFGVIKWEAPLSIMSGNCISKGNFPSFIPKTDQERIQNI